MGMHSSPFKKSGISPRGVCYGGKKRRKTIKDELPKYSEIRSAKLKEFPGHRKFRD